jgi:TetR/AcrR family transcriptional regulator
MGSYLGSVDWTDIQTIVLRLEQAGEVTRTFRRLDPARQVAVVNAILEEAGEKGPNAVNIKEIAHRAGVSVGSLYQYFGNRRGLLGFAVALCVRYTVSLFEQFGPSLAALPLRDALRAYIMGGIEWSETERGLVRFLCRAAYEGDPGMTDSVVRPVAEVMLETTQMVLSQAADRGEVRRDVDLDAASRVVNALLIAVGDSQLLPYLNQYSRVTDGDMPLERVVDALIELLEDGLTD